MKIINIVKVFLQLALLILFSMFFGVPSCQKYFENQLLLSEGKLVTLSIPAPAITICGRDSETNAWKNEQSMTPALNSCNGSKNVCTCVDSKAWAIEDVILGAQKGYELKENLMQENLWKPLFFKLVGTCFTFASDKHIGTDDYVDELEFFLNKSMVYTFYIHSPDYFVQNYLPLTLPCNLVKIFPMNNDWNSYLQLRMTRQLQLQ